MVFDRTCQKLLKMSPNASRVVLDWQIDLMFVSFLNDLRVPAVPACAYFEFEIKHGVECIIMVAKTTGRRGG